jgi:hypothetical protein
MATPTALIHKQGDTFNYPVQAYCWKCDTEPILNVLYTWDSEKDLWHKGENAEKFTCPECVKYTATHPNSPPATIIIMGQPEWLQVVQGAKKQTETGEENEKCTGKCTGGGFLKRLFRP